MARDYIGAGWRKKTKSGVDCISIKINEDANVRNGENLVLYKTREKKSDASPDFNLCRETRDDQGGGNRQGQGQRPQGGQQRPQGGQGQQYPNRQGSHLPNQGGQRPQQRPQQQNQNWEQEEIGVDDVPF